MFPQKPMQENQPPFAPVPPLVSPTGTPFQFAVTLRQERQPDTLDLEVTGPSPFTGRDLTTQYRLPLRDHASYLALFARLAQEFGLRVPLNLQASAPKPVGQVPYRVLLTQPLHPQILYGYGDPAVLRVEGSSGEGGRYYLLATSNDAPASFPILRSPDLEAWEWVGFVFPEGQKPLWAADGLLVSDYWAPELHRVGPEYRVYFVARDQHTRELCIGLARAASPEGPYRADPAPVLSGNVIDPHLYVQDDQVTYLFWKEDNNDVWPQRLLDLLTHQPGLVAALFKAEADQRTASFILALWAWARSLEPMERFQVMQVFIEAVTSQYLAFYDQLSHLWGDQPMAVQQQIREVQRYMKTPLFAQQLSADGTTLVGERTQIIENDLAWEAHLVEGMWVTRQADRFYLFYAGNDFSTDQYGIGVAHADHLLGPYHKSPSPILQTTAEWWAPGHPSVVTGPDGKPQLILHAYFPGKAGYKEFRAVLAVPLTFHGPQVTLG
ncbi:family 43 glycosylhydrolase [Rufibacter psychrotolerans]|uniref:family 43 glycosylhydrolase n=1 Tax=Rufibacter psychrotolerans TaxID=2812556 RepID=UPI001967FC06|nr:family 43 glycosylhydrolase [Rufibacter sp. SYSU D00308]